MRDSLRAPGPRPVLLPRPAPTPRPAPHAPSPRPAPTPPRHAPPRPAPTPRPLATPRHAPARAPTPRAADAGSQSGCSRIRDRTGTLGPAGTRDGSFSPGMQPQLRRARPGWVCPPRARRGHLAVQVGERPQFRSPRGQEGAGSEFGCQGGCSALASRNDVIKTFLFFIPPHTHSNSYYFKATQKLTCWRMWRNPVHCWEYTVVQWLWKIVTKIRHCTTVIDT